MEPRSNCAEIMICTAFSTERGSLLVRLNNVANEIICCLSHVHYTQPLK